MERDVVSHSSVIDDGVQGASVTGRSIRTDKVKMSVIITCLSEGLHSGDQIVVCFVGSDSADK
jgi:hypothetical protein